MEVLWVVSQCFQVEVHRRFRFDYSLKRWATFNKVHDAITQKKPIDLCRCGNLKSYKSQNEDGDDW